MRSVAAGIERSACLCPRSPRPRAFLGDAGKTDADWFWLIGYLAGKAMRAESIEKLLHHIITTAAACLNWHGARVGHYEVMRPGIDGDAAMSATPPAGEQ